MVATDMDHDQVTEADIAALAEKLAACARTMPRAEQALLARLIGRAATAKAEFTDGYTAYPLDLVGRAGTPPDRAAVSRALGLSLVPSHRPLL